MAELTLYKPARSSLLVPVALAVLVLAAATFLLLRYTPHRIADLTVTHTVTWQTHTVFKTDTILVGQDKTQDDLYVLATLRIQDDLKLPLFVKDFTATLTTATGDTLEASAVEQPDLANLFTTYPALKALASNPLYRDTTIAPSQSAEGMVVLHFPVTADTWSHRQSATLTTAFYHQPPMTTPIH